MPDQISKVRRKNEKTAGVTMMRDLFGSILFLSLQKKVDMAEVFCYPLTPVPLSLCHVDGTMLKSPKVKLLQELESRIVSTPPSYFDAAFVDGCFFCIFWLILQKRAFVILNKVLGSFNCRNIHFRGGVRLTYFRRLKMVFSTLTCLIVGGGGLIVRGGRHFLKNV